MGRDSALKGRLIIGAIVGIYFLVQYLASRELDEVTGERHQFAYSVEKEIEIGQAAAPKFIRENGGEASGRAAEMVRRLGNVVVRNTIASKSSYPFQFHLLNDDVTVNAFALPGGHVFITNALLRKLENEAQLAGDRVHWQTTRVYEYLDDSAGVLGHEVGHIVHRHSSRQTAKQELGSGIVLALLSLLLGEGSSSQTKQLAEDAASMVTNLVMMKYGRKDETDSDTFGLKAMAQSGFRPQEMVGVMRILGEASGDKGKGRVSEWASSHPLSEHRIEDITKWIKTEFPNGVPARLGRGNAV